MFALQAPFRNSSSERAINELWSAYAAQSDMAAAAKVTGARATIGGMDYVYSSTSLAKAISTVAATDVVTATSHGFLTGQLLKFTATTAGGLTDAGVYYCRKIGANTFYLFDTLYKATNATVMGGTISTISQTGTTITIVFTTNPLDAATIAAGEFCVLTGATDAALNGTFPVATWNSGTKTMTLTSPISKAIASDATVTVGGSIPVNLDGTEAGTLKPFSCSFLVESSVTPGTYWSAVANSKSLSIPHTALTANDSTLAVAKANRREIEQAWWYYTHYAGNSFDYAAAGAFTINCPGICYIDDTLNLITANVISDSAMTDGTIVCNTDIYPSSNGTWTNKPVVRLAGHLVTHRLKVNAGSSPTCGAGVVSCRTASMAAGISTFGNNASWQTHYDMVVTGKFTEAAVINVAAETSNYYNLKVNNVITGQVSNTILIESWDHSGYYAQCTDQSTTEIRFHGGILQNQGDTSASSVVKLRHNVQEVAFRDCYFASFGTAQYMISYTAADGIFAASEIKGILVDGGRWEASSGTFTGNRAFYTEGTNTNTTIKNFNITMSLDYVMGAVNTTGSIYTQYPRFENILLTGASGKKGLYIQDDYATCFGMYVDCPTVRGDTTADSSEANHIVGGGVFFQTTQNLARTAAISAYTIMGIGTDHPFSTQYDLDNFAAGATNHYHARGYRWDARLNIQSYYPSSYIKPRKVYTRSWGIAGNILVLVPCEEMVYTASGAVTINYVETPHYGIRRFHLTNASGSTITIKNKLGASNQYRAACIICNKDGATTAADMSLTTGLGAWFEWINIDQDQNPQSNSNGFWKVTLDPA